MTLRTLLVDDEPLALDRIKAGFAALAGVEIVGTAANGRQAIDQIAALRPDLVLMDIQMPGQNGIAVARALEQAGRPEIIFVTAFDYYAPEAFDVEAVDYLLKPVKFERLRIAVERARRRRAMRDADGRAAELELVVDALRAVRPEAAPSNARYDDELWVPTRNGLLRVPVDTIDWIEAAKDYVLLHTASRSHMIRMTMAALQERLDPTLIMRVHRSAFVRIGAVAELLRQGKSPFSLRLHDDVVVQVGPAYTRVVLTALGAGAGQLR